jgi:hypothetical protein
MCAIILLGLALLASIVGAEEEPALPKKFDYLSKPSSVAGFPIRIGLASDHPFLAEYRIWLLAEPKGRPKEVRYLAWDTGGFSTTYLSKTKDGKFIFWNGGAGALLVDPVSGKISKAKNRDVEGWEKSLVGRFFWDPSDDTQYCFFTEEQYQAAYKKD